MGINCLFKVNYKTMSMDHHLTKKTKEVKDPVPLVGKSRASCPGAGLA